MPEGDDLEKGEDLVNDSDVERGERAEGLDHGDGMGSRSAAESTGTHCGFVALLGAPNVGKSTLFNAVVGESLSIATPKAQTTQRKIAGIRTEGDCQFVFLDAPGILEPRYGLQKSLLHSARQAARDADVVAFVIDPTRRAGKEELSLLLQVAGDGPGKRIGVVTKVDLATPSELAAAREWLITVAEVPVYEVSGVTGQGIDELVAGIRGLLPSGPFLFPEDDLAIDPVRFFVAERIREVLFDQFREEIPYAAFCAVEEFREGESPIYIAAMIYVERPSQKGILIGAGGQAIRGIGIAARERIEHFLGEAVYLDLRVKVLPGWRRNREELRRLGFPVPEDDEESRR